MSISWSRRAAGAWYRVLETARLSPAFPSGFAVCFSGIRAVWGNGRRGRGGGDSPWWVWGLMAALGELRHMCQAVWW